MTIDEKAELAISLMERAKDAIANLAALIRQSNARPVDGVIADSQFARAMEALDDIAEMFEEAPDSEWWSDYYTLSGEHWVCTEEGWIPAELNTFAATGAEPMEVICEVNAP